MGGATAPEESVPMPCMTLAPFLRTWIPLVLAVVMTLGAGTRAAQAQSAEAGLLSVTATVEGAEVWVDGVLAGPSPLTRYLPPGNHMIRVVADHHDPFVRRVDVTAGLTTRVEARLLPGGGTIEFLSNAPGARVFVSGRDVGPTPIRLKDISPGTHTWRVEAEGYEPKEAEFTFGAGSNLLFDVTLRSLEGLFVVQTTPPGARVWLDGTEVGETPVELEGVPRGRHQVRVKLAGHAELFRTVDTTAGGKGEVISSLSTEGVALVVKTGRADATVRLAGHLLGTGRTVRLPALERGTLDVVVEAPGHLPAQRTIQVRGEGRIVLEASLVAADHGGRSELATLPPLYRRWTFWTAAGGVVAAGTAGGIVLNSALNPEPPSGDVVVVLP